MILTFLEATEMQEQLSAYAINFHHPDDFDQYDNDDEDIADDADEFFDDDMEAENDLNEIRVGDDLREPDPEDDDHLPDDDLQ